MADKRMFSSKIVQSDAFLEMDLKSQALYFHLCLAADDEGFVGKPRTITRMIGAELSNLQELIKNKFILLFDTGVIVIKHWRINNVIRKDRRKPTTYLKEKSCLNLTDNESYSLTNGDNLIDLEQVFPNIWEKH